MKSRASRNGTDHIGDPYAVTIVQITAQYVKGKQNRAPFVIVKSNFLFSF